VLNRKYHTKVRKKNGICKKNRIYAEIELHFGVETTNKAVPKKVWYFQKKIVTLQRVKQYS